VAEPGIRPLEERDLPRLVELYNHFIRNTAVTFETETYTVESRKPWLVGFAPTGRYRCLVAHEGGRALGWASSRRFHERAAYAPTVETSVYLDPAVHGRGLGRRLYGALLDALAGEDVHRAVGSITLPNDASVALHRSLGFEPMGAISEVGRKLGRWWDVAWYVKALP
jgi:phosphinothricin acetyltransferase